MCFNASDASGAAGLSGDIATVAAMGAHALPVVTSIVMRDTADVFDQHLVDPDAVAEQARTVLEDVTVAAWKVGFLGSADGVSAVAEILSDYTEVPLVAYLPALTWLPEDQLQPYLDAFRELILPAAEVLVGNHQALRDFLLPDWDNERPPSARELAVAAGEHGTRHVLVTGILLPSKGKEQYIDNVLATPQGAIAGEKFEMFDTAFVGAGDTLAAALAALLASGSDMTSAVSEALSFLDQSLDAGFRPGMGNIVPDRFFWALPPPEEGEEGQDGQAGSAGPAGGSGSGGGGSSSGPGGAPPGEREDPKGKGQPRRVH
ncbi:MAG: bifunctional hydroxymethylpyrimidine kinase/phosphomethylpyrimidine kinase [Rubrivivax sp.]|nr:bifunctional hydroxymethylpyrimidine kinase/phosphomethylpyrimidine kinase [Rubrivivax sp.]